MAKLKRVATTITVYNYGENEQQCYDEAKRMVKILNDTYDCNANVYEIRNAQFGTINRGELIDKSKLK